MKHRVMQFDTSLARAVGVLPKSLHDPAVWLGKATLPVLWASYIAVIHVGFLTPGVLRGTGLLVIVLLPLASVCKLVFRRHRPPTIYTDSMKIKSYSFPSSHAYSAALAGGYVAVLTATSGDVLITIMLCIAIACIGISRVFVGAHYPSDVLAGWALGLAVLAMLSVVS